MKKKLLCSLVVFTLLFSVNPVQAKAKLQLNKTYITISKKSTFTLKVSGTKKKTRWYSSKKSIASVNKNGKVYAKKSGTAYITAKVGKKKMKCKISVRSAKSIKNKLTDAYNWQCEDIWNNGFCDIYHYIENGTNAYGNKMNINKTIDRLNKAYKKRTSYNKFVYSVQGKKYSKYKSTWKKLDKETVRLKNILDKNGVPKPKTNYYFPYEKYSDYLWKLLDKLDVL